MINLPKWPALVVVGEAVTREQAAEIIVRTQSFDLSTNDRIFKRQVEDLIGVPKHPDYSDTPEYLIEARKCWAAMSSAVEKYRCLSLEYLGNGNRIVSCYVGGPHGWCNWNGRIGCNSHNIGKWPSHEAVLAEWQAIAAAFPFLKLKAQLFNGEHCEDGIEPIVQYNVANGTVEVVEPEMLGDPETGDMNYDLFSPGGERGCTLETLKWALEVTSGNQA